MGYEQIRSGMLEVLSYVYDFEFNVENEYVVENKDLLAYSEAQWKDDPKYWLHAGKVEEEEEN